MPSAKYTGQGMTALKSRTFKVILLVTSICLIQISLKGLFKSLMIIFWTLLGPPPPKMIKLLSNCDHIWALQRRPTTSCKPIEYTILMILYNYRIRISFSKRCIWIYFSSHWIHSRLMSLFESRMGLTKLSILCMVWFLAQKLVYVSGFRESLL